MKPIIPVEASSGSRFLISPLFFCQRLALTESSDLMVFHFPVQSLQYPSRTAVIHYVSTHAVIRNARIFGMDPALLSSTVFSLSEVWIKLSVVIARLLSTTGPTIREEHIFAHSCQHRRKATLFDLFRATQFRH